ncbi:hypothetical protein CFOL_v3_26570, partial [Cephalotus follicularis]
FVEQYDKALLSHREAEEREDFMTMNSNATLRGRTSLERIVGDCYTGEMFKLFQKEFIDSRDCRHKRVNKEGTTKRYKVWLYTDEEWKWYSFVYDESESVTDNVIAGSLRLTDIYASTSFTLWFRSNYKPFLKNIF